MSPNPHGRTLSVEERDALLEVAKMAIGVALNPLVAAQQAIGACPCCVARVLTIACIDSVGAYAGPALQGDDPSVILLLTDHCAEVLARAFATAILCEEGGRRAH